MCLRISFSPAFSARLPCNRGATATVSLCSSGTFSHEKVRFIFYGKSRDLSRKKRRDLKNNAGDAGCLRSTGVGATSGRPVFVSSVTATTRRSRICGRPMVAPTGGGIRCATVYRGRSGHGGSGVCATVSKQHGSAWRYRDAAVWFCAAGVTLALAINALRQQSNALKFLKEGCGERTFAKVLSPCFYVPSVFLWRGFYTCASQQKTSKKVLERGARGSAFS